MVATIADYDRGVPTKSARSGFELRATLVEEPVVLHRPPAPGPSGVCPYSEDTQGQLPDAGGATCRAVLRGRGRYRR